MPRRRDDEAPHLDAARSARAHRAAEGHLAQVHLGQPRRAWSPSASRRRARRARGPLPNRDIQRGARRAHGSGAGAQARDIPPSEAQALEVATALLFIESALENYFRLGADFARQAKTVTERPKSAMAGEALPPMDAIEGGLLDEMTRRAQEKLLDLPGRPGSAGEPAEHRAGAGRLLPRHRAARRARAAARAVRAGAGRAHDHGAARCRGAQRRGDGARAAIRRRLASTARATRPRWSPMACPRSASTSPRCSRARLPRRKRWCPRCSASACCSRSPSASRASCAARGTVSPGDIELQKQKVQALYEDWKGAPAETTRAKLEKSLDELEARRRGRVRFRRLAAERGRAAGDAGEHRPAAVGALPRHPQLAPGQCAGAARGAGRAAGRRARRGGRQASCWRSSSRRPPRWSAPSARASPRAATCRTIARPSPRSAAASTRSRAAAAWWA